MSLSRSQQMSRIRGRDTAPELLLRARLKSLGLKPRQQRIEVGRPDFVLKSPLIKLAVFVDGCFWHGCPEHYVPPRSRTDFWSAKLAGNVSRDARQTLELDALGWRVVRIWEHEVILGVPAAADRVVRALLPRRPRRSLEWRVFRVDWLDADRDVEKRWLQQLRCPMVVQSEVRRRMTTKPRTPAAARR